MSARWLPIGCLLLALAFGALGVWQVERRAWKLDLIERVNSRAFAEPQHLPARADWAGVSAERDEYRRVRVRGELLHERETLVQAVTDLGPGFWVLTPLRTEEGMVLVNRGFAPPERRDPAARRLGSPSGVVTITGLLRLTEPHGGFLRANDAAADRWYSRDVAAIARARGLGEVAPFFVDADGAPNPGGYPVAGLTVVRFRNTHLVYALTWFALAGLCVFGAVVAGRSTGRAAG